MALSELQQTQELIRKNKSILIIFKKDWSGDAAASSLALAETLRKLDKAVEIVCQDFKPTTSLNFLPLSQIKNSLINLQKFIISINTSQTQVGEFYYDHQENRLNIYLTPQNGQLEAKDVTTAISDYKYDLIFIINSPDLASLGEAYERQPDFFFNTPKINLDHSNRNEYFGDVNLVNITSAASAEIAYELIKSLGDKLIDDNIATYLLAGIIFSTKNFKVSNLTPKTLSIASLLVHYGARREQIIQAIYQNKFLSTLKLWGRVLSRLNNDLDDRLVWSSLSVQDFLETATTPEEILDVVEELIVSMPKTDVVVLLHEGRDINKKEVCCLVYAVKNGNALFLSKRFEPSGNSEIAKFSLNNLSLAEAERLVIGEIKSKL
ncbi:MAG: hypothetical protein WC518_03445 [Patescibacteria group bacterium]